MASGVVLASLTDEGRFGIDACTTWLESRNMRVVQEATDDAAGCFAHLNEGAEEFYDKLINEKWRARSNTAHYISCSNCRQAGNLTAQQCRHAKAEFP